MAKIFEDKHICSKCKCSFNWMTYCLNENESLVGLVKTNVKNLIKLENGKYEIILNCPSCAHGDSVIKNNNIFI